jgi:hypothetical protein
VTQNCVKSRTDSTVRLNSTLVELVSVVKTVIGFDVEIISIGDNMAHAHFTLDTYGYKHTLRICNTYCFSTATMVAPTHLNVTLKVLNVI